MWELISTRQRLIELINFLDTVGNRTGVNAINKAKDMLRVCRAGVLKHRRYKISHQISNLSLTMYKRKCFALSTASFIVNLNTLARK